MHQAVSHSGSPEIQRLICWDQTYLNSAGPAVTFTKGNKHYLKGGRHHSSFPPPPPPLSFSARGGGPKVWLSLGGMKGREPSVLSKMSRPESSLSYGTWCFNRTIWGTGNAHLSVCLCLPSLRRLVAGWWMAAYQSKQCSPLWRAWPRLPPLLPFLTLPPIFGTFRLSYLVYLRKWSNAGLTGVQRE